MPTSIREQPEGPPAVMTAGITAETFGQQVTVEFVSLSAEINSFDGCFAYLLSHPEGSGILSMADAARTTVTTWSLEDREAD